jgi:hypothetical protein
LQFKARVGQTFNIELPVRAFVQVARPCRQRQDNYSQPQSSDENVPARAIITILRDSRRVRWN